jgi:hypothetical protein
MVYDRITLKNKLYMLACAHYFLYMHIHKLLNWFLFWIKEKRLSDFYIRFKERHKKRRQKKSAKTEYMHLIS